MMFKQSMAALLHAGICMGIVIPITPLPIPTPLPIGPIAIDPPVTIDPLPVDPPVGIDPLPLPIHPLPIHPLPVEPYPEGCPTHIINHSCPAMTLHCGPQPDCIIVKTVTKPCYCPLPMPTVAAPCPTCHTGCGTIWNTVTADCYPTPIVPTPIIPTPIEPTPIIPTPFVPTPDVPTPDVTTPDVPAPTAA